MENPTTYYPAAPYRAQSDASYPAQAPTPYPVPVAAPSPAQVATPYRAQASASYQAQAAAPYPAQAAGPAPSYPKLPAISQYQSQDEAGNLSYGYSTGISVKHEHGNIHGGVTGSYSYVDQAGTHTVTYVADQDGFRVVGTDVPKINS